MRRLIGLLLFAFGLWLTWKAYVPLGHLLKSAPLGDVLDPVTGLRLAIGALTGLGGGLALLAVRGAPVFAGLACALLVLVIIFAVSQGAQASIWMPLLLPAIVTGVSTLALAVMKRKI